MSTVKRRAATRRLDELIPQAAQRALRAHGFVEAAVVTKWRAIVGDLLADHCLPEALRFPRGARKGATLTIRAEGAFAPELQHLEPLILERINVFFGYSAVARLKIVHGPLPKLPSAARTTASEAKLPPDQEQRLAKMVEDIEDPALKAAVVALGRSVFAASGAGAR